MCRYCLVVLIPLSLSAHAGLFKCVQPDGLVAYQQTACSGAAQGGALTVDTRAPGGSAPAASRDYSVESQLKAMESAREQERKARSQSEERALKSNLDVSDRTDRAKCAKHRAQVARWRQDVRDGYRNQEEKAYEGHMLEHHRALVERYCLPD